MSKTMFGSVSRDLHRCATSVRVHIPSRETDGSPLSVAATREGFAQSLFKEGTVVEVERHPRDSRRFRIVQVFDKVGRNLPEDEWDCCCDPEKEERKVRFFLGRRYFSEPQIRADLMRALNGAFPISIPEIRQLTYSGQNLGFWITCTEAQFARFLIRRDQVGIPNGFQDLRVAYTDDDRYAPDREIDVSDR